jgi:hypothetical protein
MINLMTVNIVLKAFLWPSHTKIHLYPLKKSIGYQALIPKYPIHCYSIFLLPYLPNHLLKQSQRSFPRLTLFQSSRVKSDQFFLSSIFAFPLENESHVSGLLTHHANMGLLLSPISRNPSHVPQQQML